jgi:YgiT-type zinc finger domain-containing protein
MKYDKCECGGKIIGKKVRVDFRVGDEIIVFEDVPVGVCQVCGERIYDAKVLKAMEHLARGRKKVIKRISVPVLEFSFAC